MANIPKSSKNALTRVDKEKCEMKDGIRLRGNVYWIKYSRNGKPYEESVNKVLGKRGATFAEAKRLRRSRMGAIADGRFFGLSAEKTEFGEFKEVKNDDNFDYQRKGGKFIVTGMIKVLISNYKRNKRRSIKRVFQSAWNLAIRFSGYRMAQIGTDLIDEYIAGRLEDGAKNATINRELAALRRIFHLAHDSTPPKVSSIPKIEMLEEDNVRTGYFEHKDYLTLRDEIQDYLKPVLDFGYVYGGRIRKDILAIEWSMVDMISGKIDLGKSKNGKTRIWYLTPQLYQTMLEYKMRHDRKFPKQKKVFVHPDGTPIKDFRAAWEGACKRAGLEGKLYHDFRRTAVRNMIRAGIPRNVAMMISGHLTESVFERYNIVDETDLEAARDSMVNHYDTLAKKITDFSEKVTKQVTNEVLDKNEKK